MAVGGEAVECISAPTPGKTMDNVEKIARALCESAKADPERWEEYKSRAAEILEQVESFRKKNPPSLIEENRICTETDEYVDLCVGVSGWRKTDGSWIVEDDYRVAGEVWRVHKGDADPFPSNPHAHCIGGAKRFIGCKLHLGTAELYVGSRPTGRVLAPKNFERLIELIRPKFPGLVLPLPIVAA